jgi:hypothetical protein
VLEQLGGDENDHAHDRHPGGNHDQVPAFGGPLLALRLFPLLLAQGLELSLASRHG